MARSSKPITVAGVEPRGNHRVEVLWSNGTRDVIDLGPHLRAYSLYEAARAPRRFNRVRVGADGWSLTWGDDIDISIDAIELLLREQAGRMSGALFKRWRLRRGYDIADVAEILGLSRRTISYYESGRQKVPKVVGLATLYLDNSAPDGTRTRRGLPLPKAMRLAS